MGAVECVLYECLSECVSCVSHRAALRHLNTIWGDQKIFWFRLLQISEYLDYMYIIEYFCVYKCFKYKYLKKN